ncbi:MAG: hypothetical protein ACREL5_10070 [Gemmatimonadales bacterium]
MNRRHIRAIIAALVPALFANCDHSSPIEPAYYAPAGPLIPGLEAKLALTGGDVSWTSDGTAILYAGGCLQREATSDMFGAPSINLLPASGGSAIWEMCESKNSLKRPPDSLESFGSPALNAHGELLYRECTWPNIDPVINCGNLGHITIWLADSSRPWGQRRLLYDLYHVVLGTPPDPRTRLNDLRELRWIGPATFLARGYNVNPTSGDSMLGLVIGSTASPHPTLSVLPGTDQIQAFALAGNNAVIVFFRTALEIEQMPIDGGAATKVADLPGAPGRALVDISCTGTSCLLLTTEPESGSAFWRLDLRSSALSLIRMDTAGITLARRSPTSAAVLVRRMDGYYLYSDVPW